MCLAAVGCCALKPSMRNLHLSPRTTVRTLLTAACMAVLCSQATWGYNASKSPDWGAAVAAFKTWFWANGGQLHRNVRIDLARSADARFLRLVSKGRVPRGQSIVSVPEAMLVTIPPEDRHAYGAFSPAQALALRLLDLRDSGGGFWAPYLDILPRPPLQTAL